MNGGKTTLDIKFSHYWKAFRILNLCIVALTQLGIYLLVILPVLSQAQITPGMHSAQIAGLILVTVLIAAGGYLINDYFDFNADHINQKSGKLSERSHYLILYFLVVPLGFILSVVIAHSVNSLHLTGLYILATALLFLYSATLKGLYFWGNILVALFVCFVVGIIWFAERHAFSELVQTVPEYADHASTILWTYMGFAFLTTLIREIVKDIEDIEGDRTNLLRTVPIALGIPHTKAIAYALSSALIILLGTWPFGLGFKILSLPSLLAYGTLVVPVTYFMWRLHAARTPGDYHLTGNVMKVIMISGLIYLFVISSYA